MQHLFFSSELRAKNNHDILHDSWEQYLLKLIQIIKGINCRRSTVIITHFTLWPYSRTFKLRIMKILSSFFLLVLVCAAFAENKYDVAVTKIVNHLKANKTTFHNFLLFKGVDITNYGSYKFKTIEVKDTNINFQDAVPVPGAKGQTITGYLVIDEAEIKISNLVIDGSIVVEDDGGFKFTLPFNSTQRSGNNETGGIFKLVKFSAHDSNEGMRVYPGYALYSPENIKFEVEVDCEPLVMRFRGEECYFAQEIVNDLAFGSVARALAYKIQTAIKEHPIPK